MKKSILFLALAFLAFASTAQNKTLFGVRGALNVSNIVESSSGTTTNFKSLIGFAAGVFAQVPIGTEFAIQPELDYSLKGAKFDADKLNLSYIALPILFKYTPSVVKGANVFIGPEFDYLISAKVASPGNPTTDFKNNVKNFDAGLVVGLGYDVLPNLGVDVRYDLGLVSIDKNTDPSFKATEKNNVFQVGISYKFGN